ncbi:MAG TPA: hypothetical protein VMY35_13365 [Phycisphaerae bacterium]|nr:hypothetical protein [Phycisphaerae bacterium]
MKWTMRLMVAALLVSLPATVLLSAANSGKLKVITPGMLLNLTVSGQKVAIPANKEASLPPGEYKTKGIELYAREADRRGKIVLWKITSSGSFGKLETIQIAEGQTTEVEGGEPITVKVPCGLQMQKATKFVYVGLAYIGKSDEWYSPIVYKGSSRVPAPQLQISDESGKVLHTASFEYG